MEWNFFAGLWRPAGFRASRALGTWGVALLFFHCPAVFASVASCLTGVGLGACGVAMSILPGFLALGWSVSGVVFSRSFVWAWLCFGRRFPLRRVRSWQTVFKYSDWLFCIFKCIRFFCMYSNNNNNNNVCKGEIP